MALEKGDFSFTLNSDDLALKNQNTFMDSLRNFSFDETMETSHNKSIGILLTKETIENLNFINYIKSMQLRFNDIVFSVFYFNDDLRLKGEGIFGSNNVEYILAHDILDIVVHINVFITLDYFKDNRILEKIYSILNHHNYNTLCRFLPNNLYQRLDEKDYSEATKIVFDNYKFFELNYDDLSSHHVIDLLHKKHIEGTEIQFVKRNLDLYEYENEMLMIECALISQKYIKNLKKINETYNKVRNQ
jgi:hypothetical protein